MQKREKLLLVRFSLKKKLIFTFSEYNLKIVAIFKKKNGNTKITKWISSLKSVFDRLRRLNTITEYWRRIEFDNFKEPDAMDLDISA